MEEHLCETLRLSALWQNELQKLETTTKYTVEI